jgi:hypothetical protein
MCQMISCLVSKAGKVYAKDGVHSHSDIAGAFKIDEDRHLKYEFVLTTRLLKQDFEMDAAPFAAQQSHDEAAQRFFDQCAGTPRKLRVYVKRGNWLPDYLLPLLNAPARKAYAEACATARKAHAEAIAQAWKAHAEAIAPAWKVYDEAIATAWLRLFSKPVNRIAAWR